MSKSDLEFRNAHKKEGEWLGCDSPNCSYWAHGVCAGIKIGRKRAADIKFYCPDHNQEE